MIHTQRIHKGLDASASQVGVGNLLERSQYFRAELGTEPIEFKETSFLSKQDGQCENVG